MTLLPHTTSASHAHLTNTPSMTDKNPPRRPTMTDIATRAGVSQSTVSLVLNHMSGAKVSNKTRDNVLKIATELGYPVIAWRRGDTSPRERDLIVYLVDEISTSPHPPLSIDGAKDLSWEHGCLVSVFATRSNAEMEAAVLQRMLDNPALLGVIYSTIFTRAVEVPKLLHNVPTVLLNCYSDDRAFSSVVPGDVTGGHTATQHLIDAGHRRIAYINGEPWMDAARDRLKGYRQALTTSDIPFEQALVRDGDWMFGTGFAHATSLLTAPHPPTAIYCASDLMALGAIEAAQRLGLRVPGDLAVIGYDDQEIARYTQPALSTVLLPNYEMGRWAAETLIEQARALVPAGVAGAGATRRTAIKMHCPLVERDSVAAPKAA